MLGPAERMNVSLHSIGRDAPFTRHTHVSHQVLWASEGVLAVSTESADWILPPSRALWIPAGLPHETSSSSVVVTGC